MPASALYVIYRCIVQVCILHVVIVHCQNRIWTKSVGTTLTDNGRGVATDTTTGELYVAGSTGGSLHGEPFAGQLDVLLMKYSSNGTRIWTKVVGTENIDIGYAVCVDSTRKAVYVTGSASESLHGQPYTSGEDIFLMKYSTNGTRIWTRMAGSSDSGGTTAYGTGVAIDPSTGDVFITGITSEDLDDVVVINQIDIFLSKYSSNGTRIWTKIFGGTGSDYGYAIAVDSRLNAMYVTGHTATGLYGQTNTGALDIFLLKLDFSGNLFWTRVIGTSATDVGRAVAVDPQSSAIYVTGQTAGSLNGAAYNALADIFLSKFLPNGTNVWTRSVGSSGDDVGLGVLVDGYGSVLVAGRAAGSLNSQTFLGGSGDGFMIKYSGNGTAIWTAMLGSNGSDSALAAAVGRSNTEYYVTGSVGGRMDGEAFAGGTDVFLVSVTNSQGTVQPTGQPSGQPSAQPSSDPSRQPSSQPSRQPTRQPSSQPSRQPFSQPSGQPTSQPTRQPSGQPTSQPTDGPSDTVCQHRTFREASSQVEFTTHRCFTVSNPQGANRRLLAKGTADSKPFEHRSNFLCSQFSATSQDADFQCEFAACPGDQVLVSMQPSAGGLCAGDFELQLLTESARIIAASDSALGECPVILHGFKDATECATVTVLHRCVGSSPCMGRTAVQYLQVHQ